MNTAAILPREEHCVFKCHSSESVCVTPSHLSYIIFSFNMVRQPDEAEPLVRFLFFWFLCLFAFMFQCRWKPSRKRSKVREGYTGGCLGWNDDWTHGGRPDQVEGATPRLEPREHGDVWLEEEELTPLLVQERLGASETVGLVGILGALLGWRRVSHGALGLSGTLDVALVTKAGAGVLDGWKEKTVNRCMAYFKMLITTWL